MNWTDEQLRAWSELVEWSLRAGREGAEKIRLDSRRRGNDNKGADFRAHPADGTPSTFL